MVPVNDPGELLESKSRNKMKEYLLHLHRWGDVLLQGLQSGAGPSTKLQTGERNSVWRSVVVLPFLNNLGVTLLFQVKLWSGWFKVRKTNNPRTPSVRLSSEFVRLCQFSQKGS